MFHTRLVSASLIVSLVLPTAAFASEVNTATAVPTAIMAPSAPVPLSEVAATLRTQFAGKKSITRAEFVAAAVQRLYPDATEECFTLLSPSKYGLLFRDVSKGAPYGVQICEAMRMGLIRGNPDGSFAPDKPINVAEASKILAKMFRFSTGAMKASDAWYTPYVSAMKTAGALPASFTSYGTVVTGNRLQLMLDALMKGAA